MRYDIIEEINELKKEMELSGDDYSEEIAKLEQLLNTDYTRIYVENEITLNTLRKIAKGQYYDLDRYAVDEQPLENFDNGFVTKEWLEACLRSTFNIKANGHLPNSTVALFGSERKAMFVRLKLHELLEGIN